MHVEVGVVTEVEMEVAVEVPRSGSGGKKGRNQVSDDDGMNE